MSDFIFLGSKINADCECSHKIKRCLLLGWKAMINLDSILKSKDITWLTKVHIVSQRCGFSSGHVGMWKLDHKRRLRAEELILLNCVPGKDSWESLGEQGDPSSPFERKSVLNIQWKDWCWRWNSNTLTTWCEELIHLKRPWCWERLNVGGEGDDRGWDG